MAVSATDDELEELRKAAVSGIQSVEADGRKVVYRPLDDQLRILTQADPSNSPNSRRRKFTFGRGY